MQADNIIECNGVLIVGAGIAGLFTALKLAPFPSMVLAGARPGASGSSAWAQGGIAAAVGPDDNWRSHAADTIAAGAGICDVEVVEFVVREAAARIQDLVDLGTAFDRNPDGTLARAREAAHSHERIVHVQGDRAGAEVSRVLAERALGTPAITSAEGFRAVELATEDGRVTGVFAKCGGGRRTRLVLFRSHAVILATGGIGALYALTTNPPESTGQGIGMAARAGAVIADAEFVQFHPTAIAIGRDPAPLATEALRGEGAVLIDETGRRFMPAIHADAELAPRDVVARAVHREIVRGHRVFLDCRDTLGPRFAEDYPTVYATCRSAGIDPGEVPIPVAPATHYYMGGIATDHRGRSSLPGLWAVGECAATGLHGANRLASNSLLEAIVFGARVADDVAGLAVIPNGGSAPPRPTMSGAGLAPKLLRETMSRDMGLERNEDGLRSAVASIDSVECAANGDPSVLNMTATARILAAAALLRRESRGAHFRSDYPARANTAQRSQMTLADANRLIVPMSPIPSRHVAS